VSGLLALGLWMSVQAVAAVPLDKRTSCVYTCGTVCYWQSDINAALAKGYSLYQSGSTVGT